MSPYRSLDSSLFSCLQTPHLCAVLHLHYNIPSTLQHVVDTSSRFIPFSWQVLMFSLHREVQVFDTWHSYYCVYLRIFLLTSSSAIASHFIQAAGALVSLPSTLHWKKSVKSCGCNTVVVSGSLLNIRCFSGLLFTYIQLAEIWNCSWSWCITR